MMTEQDPSNQRPMLKVAALDSKVTISGPLIEVGAVNRNDWGMGYDEVPNYMANVIGNPLRKCSGIDEAKAEHSCDYNWNPDDDIGRITGAHLQDGWIHATAEVTDTIAQRKIREGTWDPYWSSFLSHKAQSAGRMVSKTKPLSVTLVKDPAYIGAGFTVQNQTPKKEASRMADETKYTQEDVDKLVAAAVDLSKKDHISNTDADALVAAAVGKEKETTKDMLTSEDADKLVAAAVAEHTKKLEEASGAGKEPMSKNDVEELVSAAVATATETSIPREDVETLVAAAVAKAKDTTIETLTVERLAEDVLEKQVSAGIIEQKDVDAAREGLLLKSAAVLESDLDMYTKVNDALVAAGTEAVNKFKTAHIPAGGLSEKGFSVGNFNNGKDWSDT